MTGSVNFNPINMQNVLNQIPIEYTAMAIDYLRNRRDNGQATDKKKIVLSARVLEHMSQFADPGADLKSLKEDALQEEYKR